MSGDNVLPGRNLPGQRRDTFFDRLQFIQYLRHIRHPGNRNILHHLVTAGLHAIVRIPMLRQNHDVILSGPVTGNAIVTVDRRKGAM